MVCRTLLVLPLTIASGALIWRDLLVHASACSICFHFGLPFTIYVAITFCPFVSLEQRALALALFHIFQLNNGMRYQTVLEQVTLQSSKGTFRE